MISPSSGLSEIHIPAMGGVDDPVGITVCPAPPMPIDAVNASLKAQILAEALPVVFAEGPTSQSEEPFALELAEKIYKITGVQSGGVFNSGVTISTYEIRIGKGMAFTDEEIEEPIVAIIAEAFGLTIEEIDCSLKSERHMLPYYEELDRRMADSFGGGELL